MIAGIWHASARGNIPSQMTGDAGLTPGLQNAAIKGKLENGLDEERTNSNQEFVILSSEKLRTVPQSICSFSLGSQPLDSKRRRVEKSIAAGLWVVGQIVVLPY